MKVAAALPPEPLPPMLMRTSIPLGEVYGVGPMMTATEVMKRQAEAMRGLLETMDKHHCDILDCIDWDQVHKDLGAYGTSVTYTERVR